jgi:hypothetical protein
MGTVIATLPCSSYVSRRVSLSSALACEVFDAYRADRQLRSADPVRWTVPANARAHLSLEGAGLTRPPHAGRSWPLRAVPGTLHAGRPAGSFGVELELNPWSEGRCELAVRLTGRKRASDRYLASAGAIVDGLASDLELRGLLALHPSHTTGTASQQPASASAWL